MKNELRLTYLIVTNDATKTKTVEGYLVVNGKVEAGSTPLIECTINQLEIQDTCPGCKEDTYVITTAWEDRTIRALCSNCGLTVAQSFDDIEIRGTSPWGFIL